MFYHETWIDQMEKAERGRSMEPAALSKGHKCEEAYISGAASLPLSGSSVICLAYHHLNLEYTTTTITSPSWCFLRYLLNGLLLKTIN